MLIVGGAGDQAILVSIVVIALLLILLVERELLRCFGEPDKRSSMRALEMAAAPLLYAFVLIVIVRLAEIVRS